MIGLKLQELVAIATMAVGVVCQLSVSPIRGGTGGFTCPQERGIFEAPGDCTRFFQCDGGVATMFSCPLQLVFNPPSGRCEFPHHANNPNCAQGASPLSPETSQLCRNNPGNPGEAFTVPHPTYCNAFYTCTSYSYINDPCTFCGEGLYYNAEAGGCRDYQLTGLDPNTVCQGRQIVPHAEKIARTVDGTCWPFAAIPNRYQPILELLRGGITRPTVRPG